MKRSPKFKDNLKPSIIFKPGKFQEYLTWKEKRWFTEDDGETWQWEYVE